MESGFFNRLLDCASHSANRDWPHQGTHPTPLSPGASAAIGDEQIGVLKLPVRWLTPNGRSNVPETAEELTSVTLTIPLAACPSCVGLHVASYEETYANACFDEIERGETTGYDMTETGSSSIAM